MEHICDGDVRAFGGGELDLAVGSFFRAHGKVFLEAQEQ
jgi:hypothetical protein